MLQRAHYELWRAWRLAPTWALSERAAYEAIGRAGYPVEQAGDVLDTLCASGDIKRLWWRDIPTYSVLKDDLGFTATKGT